MLANLIAAAVLSLGCSAIGGLRNKGRSQQPKRIVSEKDVSIAKGILSKSGFKLYMESVEVKKEEPSCLT